MRLAFEFEFNFGLRYRNLLCKLMGHKYKKYVDYYGDGGYLSLRSLMPQTQKPIKQCERCLDIIYKKIKQKPRTVSFKRYSELK